MASPKRLGRGLDALLGSAPTTDLTTPPAARGLQAIALTRIVPNPNQPRTTFDPVSLDELRASIAEFGVLVPIIVRAAGAGYELIAGERRWRAAQLAQLETIPAIVRPADDRESLEVAIVENLQRENLDPLEEAMGFAHLVESFGFTQERVAERVGRSRPAIANALRLLALSDPIKALVRAGKLSAGHARALLALPVERREEAAQRAVREGLSVRALERLAPPGSVKRKTARVRSADESEWLERLRYRFATHIAHERGARGGKIEIRYADDDDLARIVELLLGDSPS
ncbi:MAG: ParB/RepB/Spo0J family partition protein [Candidatus Velthaea sp.]